jgi:TonB family protein
VQGWGHFDLGAYIVIAAILLAGDLVSNPDWVRKPDGAAVAEAYPGLAGFLKIEGRATVACAVADTGATRNCEVIFERPARLGFGQAALKLAKDFQMRPLTVSGVPIDGGAVRIPLAFKLPADEPATTDAGASKPTASALGLAHKLLANSGVIDEVAPDLRRAIATMDYTVDPGIDPKVWQRAVQAYDAAYRETLPAISDRLADLLAETFTEAQLARLAEVGATPGGKADLARLTRPVIELMTLDSVLLEMVRRRAHDRFCAEIDCIGSPAVP